MRVLGIDPGNEGGLVLLSERGEIASAWPMPRAHGRVNWRGVLALLQTAYDRNVQVAVERQMPFTRKDGAGAGGGAGMMMAGTIAMLENYGRLKLCIELAGDWPVTEIMPGSWRASYRPRKGALGASPVAVPGETPATRVEAANRANKKASVAIADAMWPLARLKMGTTWTEGTAEAALIAEYLRRQQRAASLQQEGRA